MLKKIYQQITWTENYMCYQDRLKLCNLEPLETCSLHADLILMNKMINCTIHVDLHNFVSITYSQQGVISIN